MNSLPFIDCCGATPLSQLDFIDDTTASELEALFKVMGNANRVRMIHAIMRAGELCVTDIADAIAMKPQAVSNQLQRLVDRGVLASRRDGNHIYYRVINPCVGALLEYALCILKSTGSMATMRSDEPDEIIGTPTNTSNFGEY